jgi:uncharacterized protein (DUF2236 family)
VLSTDDQELLHRAGIVDLPPASEGLFREGCWLRKISAEQVLLFGGGRALLLEVAHPLVAAGVADHSNFREDPFSRLQRTLEAMSAIVFSKRDVALAAVRGVERAHQRIRGSLETAAGPFAAGTAYSGRDPELVQWVWATLVDTSLVVYERFVDDLSAEVRERYYADHRRVGSLLGVPEELLPPDHVAFRAWFDERLESEALTVTDTARAIAASVLDPPVPVPGSGFVRTLTAGLLPSRLREAYGLAWDDSRAAKLAALGASVRALRKGAGKAANA